MEFMDIHSHILPGIDDGAATVADSKDLLLMLKKQGVTDVILTPHFNASIHNIDDFEEQKSARFAELQAAVADLDLPKIYEGCEVQYFSGIGNVEDIRRLCIKGTNFLLLEFGMLDFDYAVDLDIHSLIDRQNITPIIAHAERYFRFRGYRNLLHMIETGDVLCQINAGSLYESFGFKCTAKKLLRQNLVNFLGSDAHSVTGRPPRIKEALEFIEKKYGAGAKRRLVNNSLYLRKEIKGE